MKVGPGDNPSYVYKEVAGRLGYICFVADLTSTS